MTLPPRRRQAVTLPLSPLIDIIFILLLFVVLVARFTDDGQLPVRPPAAEASQALPDNGPLIVVLEESGALSIRSNPVEPDRLLAILTAARAEHSALLLMGDEGVALQGAVHVLDAAGAAGFEEVGVITRPHDQGPPTF